MIGIVRLQALSICRLLIGNCDKTRALIMTKHKIINICLDGLIDDAHTHFKLAIVQLLRTYFDSEKIEISSITLKRNKEVNLYNLR